MRENYFKSFFKSFGFIPALIAFFAVCVAAYLGIYHKISTNNVSTIIAAVVFCVGAGFAFLGLSNLKNEKINLTDFVSFVYLLASIAIGIACFATKTTHMRYGIAYCCLAGVLFLETIVRFIKCHAASDRSYKYYYGAIAGKYNPLLILCLGVIVAVVAIVLAKYVPNLSKYFVNTNKYKFYFIGFLGIIGLLTLLSTLLDNDTEVTIFDLALSVAFVAGATLSLIVLPTAIVGASFKKYTLVFTIAIVACLLVRGIAYPRQKSYVNSMHKVRTYFKSTYDKYDIILPFLFGLAALALVGVSIVAANPTKTFYLTYRFLTNNGKNPFDATTQLVYVIIAVALLVLGVLLTFVYNKFRSQEIVRTDKVLVFLLFASTTILAFEVVGFAFLGASLAISNLVATIAAGVVFLYALIVQFIRIRNYNPIAAFATATPYKQEAQPEQQPEEEAQPEEEVQEEAEEEDPFGLTEEDEAIYEAIYGKDEEEKPQEEVVEEVVEEVPAEEEVVEEEEAEEGEEEYEEEEAEEAEEYEEGTEEEEVPAEEAKKESNIVIQDFQVIDENGEPKKIKRKFNTKMMFAPYETKEYYNEIKNYLTMYRAKGRISARCETFRYKGLVAKVALGGKSIKVFLALDPSIIDENPKYHLRDFSEKKQYQEVPVMIRVRSPRSLKYFKELVDLMMANRSVKPKRNFEPTDYMPSLIPNGEAILASLGMSTYYLQDTMNVRGIPEEMPDNLEEYIPMIAGDPLEDEEVEANVYLDTLCQHFEDGQEVTIDVLKSMHIVTRGNVIHIKARGTLDRKLIIYAEKFDSDALKMLMCTNCTAVKIVR